MGRPITMKRVQEHINCTCGWNSVSSDEYRIKSADLRKMGAKRRIDGATGEVWWSLRLQSDCEGQGHNQLDDY